MKLLKPPALGGAGHTAAHDALAAALRRQQGTVAADGVLVTVLSPRVAVVLAENRADMPE